MRRLAIRLTRAPLLPRGEGGARSATDEGARKREARFAREPSPQPLSRRRGGPRHPPLNRMLLQYREQSFSSFSALLASLAGPALAVQPDEVMKDPALETRARALSGELRCLVCQNELIDDSEAPLARDIRVLIRERIGKGESNDAVRAYLVSRYGDFILLKPPFKPETLLLWLSPVLTLGLGVAARFIRPPPRAQRDAALERGGGSAARGADRRRRPLAPLAPARASRYPARGFLVRKAWHASGRRGLFAGARRRAELRRRGALARQFLRQGGRGANSISRAGRPAGPIAARRPCLSANSRAGRPFRRK